MASPQTTIGSARLASHGAGRLLVLAGLVGPLTFMVLVAVLGVLVDGYNPVRDSMSELGAVDSPYRLVMNIAGFMGLGVAIVVFSAGYHLQLRPGPLELVATCLLVIAGGFMIAVGFFPCDSGCVDVTATGRLHSLTSMPQAIGLPLAAMVSAPATRADGRFDVRWQAFSFWTGLVALGTGPLVATGLGAATIGLTQRAGMGLSLIWMMAVSVKLRRVEPHTEHASQSARGTPGEDRPAPRR